MKTVYIHIGLGKTGTSFLQSTFAYNRSNYLMRALSYPDLQNDHSVAISGATTCGNALSIAAHQVPALSYLNNSISPAELLTRLDDTHDHLLSSEWLSGCSSTFLQALKQILSERFGVQFLAAVRDPSEHIVSVYQEGLKTAMYRLPIENYIDDLIVGTRRLFHLILDLKHSIHLVNYDFNRNHLIDKFDAIIFGELVSKAPPFQTVNPSPDAYQTLILQLANSLGLSDQSSTRSYIAKNEGNPRPKYQLPGQIADKIYRELDSEIREINNLLPEKEPLGRRDVRETVAQIDLLQQRDIEFLSRLIQKKITSDKMDDLAFIASCAEKTSSLENQKLPEGFNVATYLVHNPDLIAARVNPINHYLTYGVNEGRRFK